MSTVKNGRIAVIGAIAAACVLVISSLTTMILAIQTNARTARTVHKAEVLEGGHLRLEDKTDQIHILVNSRLSEALQEIANLRAQVERLGGHPAATKEGKAGLPKPQTP